MEKQYYDEFRYVEFIRNPIFNNLKDNIETNPNIKCIALDYFDVIYSKKVDTFEKCMISENNIPCEAYQSIGLFRRKKENDDDPFDIGDDYPFFSILQVTFTPEYYIFQNDITEDILQYNYNFLNTLVKNQHNNYLKKENQTINLKYQVYYTVNTMDFCIVLTTNCMDFPVFLSNAIRAQTEKQENTIISKYAVYTVMGIYKNFKNTNNIYVNDDIVLVSRVHLKRNFFSSEKVKGFIDNLSKNNITDTHSLLGRYDLTIRINQKNNVLNILPIFIKYIVKSLNNLNNLDTASSITVVQSEQSSHEIEDKQYNNTISWLVDNECLEYLNARIFFNCKQSLEYLYIEEKDTKELRYNIKHSDKIHKLFKEIEEKVTENIIFNPLKGYIDKIHNLVHMYIALYYRYDTNISIKMFGSYLYDFLNLLSMNLEFVDSEYNCVSVEDIKINLLFGINYLQQYINVVTSVNSSSFEAPKYETEKDECCIVKLPIAYTQFLDEIFKNYYERRQNRNDPEFKYFPLYRPLVVPYMQNGDSDFMMMTLLAQSMTDNWFKIQGKWTEYVTKYGVLMFIICQDTESYKDISSLIISSFHELGHYCNGITRAEKSSDIIEIFSEEVAKQIINRCISMSNSSYQTIIYATLNSSILRFLNDCIYDGLIKFINSSLEDECKEQYLTEENQYLTEENQYLRYPSSVIIEKISNILNGLTNMFADSQNFNIFNNKLEDECCFEAKYMFGVSMENAEKNSSTNTILFIISKILDKINLDPIKDSSFFTNNNIKLYINKLEEIKFHIKNLNDNNDIDIIKDAEELQELAGKIDIINNNSTEVTKLRNVLNQANFCIAWCLQIIEKFSVMQIVEENGQNIKKDKLETIIKNKEKLISNITDYYFNNCQNIFEFSEMDIERDYCIELYSKIHICPDSDQTKFKKLLNDALLELSIPEAVLDLAKSCYVESLADIIMCANLGLTVHEYIFTVKNYYIYTNDKLYSEADQRVARLIIVIAYIMFKDYIQNAKKEKILFECVYKLITEEYISKFKYEKENYQTNKTEIIYNLISDNISLIIKSKLFKVMVKRIYDSIDNFKFINNKESETKYDLSFVKDSIKSKDENQEKSPELQNKEINFILKYYYKNRSYYANYKQCETEKEGTE